MNALRAKKYLGATWDLTWQHPYQTPFLGSLFDAVESGDIGAWSVMAPSPTVQGVDALDAMMKCARHRSLQVLNRCWVSPSQLPKWLDPADANVRLRFRLQTLTHRYLRKGRWLEAGRRVDELPPELWPDDEIRNGPAIKKMEWLLTIVHLINVPPWIPAPDTHFLWGEELTPEREPLLSKLIEDAGTLRRAETHLLDGLCLSLKSGEHYGPDKLRKTLDEAHQRGLVVWITDLTVHEADDQLHQKSFAALFNVAWEHAAVVGVTLGSIEEPLTFNKQKTDGCLVRGDRSERPAFAWLREFVAEKRAPGGRVLTGPSLEELSDRVSRPLGTANAFEVTTSDGAAAMWRGPREYDFAPLEQQLGRAKENGLPFRAVVRLAGVPGWLQTGKFPPKELEQLLKDYLTAAVSKHKGTVTNWEVDGTARDSGGFWREKLGDDYLRHVFRWMHEADPGATLFCRQDAVLPENANWTPVRERLTRYVHEGDPVHGIALRAHCSLGEIRPNLRLIEENVRHFASLGLKVHFSDVAVGMRLPPDYDRLLLQAEEYRALVELYLRLPEVSAFVLSDPATGLFAHQNPEPAYFAIQDALLRKVTAIDLA